MGTPGNALGIVNPEDDDPAGLATMFDDEEPGDQVSGQQPPPPEDPNAEFPAVFDENDLDPDEEEDLEEQRRRYESARQDTGEAPAEEQPPGDGEETDEEREERLYAGRFQNVEQLESSYREIQGGFTRMAQDNQRLATQSEQLQAQLAQMQQDQATMAQAVQAVLAEQDPDAAAALQAQMEQEQRLQQQVAAQTQPLQQQLQRQQLQQQFDGVVQGFYQRHTDIEPGSPEDGAFTQFTNELVGMMRSVNLQPNLLDPTIYELAYEGFTNPTFGAELLLNPNAIRSPQALARLRERAGATIQREQQGPQTPSQQAGTRGAARQPTARKRVEAHVEQPSGGTPPGGGAPGKKPGDEFDEAAEWYTKRFRSRGPLFGGS